MDDMERINNKLLEIFRKENGYFGRVKTWGQRPTEYENIGLVPSKDFMEMLSKLPEEKQKELGKIINYFEIHARPLKNLLNAEESEQLYKFFSEIAWSHFATIIMFGMLEVTTKAQSSAKLDKYGNLQNKGEEIKKFLENYLPQSIKDGIAKRYDVDGIFGHKKPTNFEEAIEHLWEAVRCGFVHEAGFEHKGLEYSGFGGGIGTKEDPITIKQDAPMQELLQMAWQAILNFYGYDGILDHN